MSSMLPKYVRAKLEEVGRKCRKHYISGDYFWLADAADDVQKVLEDFGIDAKKVMQPGDPLCTAVWIAFDHGLHSGPCRMYDPLRVVENACAVCGFGEEQH